MALPFFFFPCLQLLPHPEVWRRGGQDVGVTLVLWLQRERAPQQEGWGHPEHLCLKVEELIDHGSVECGNKLLLSAT